jgi:hypothetical protein
MPQRDAFVTPSAKLYSAETATTHLILQAILQKLPFSRYKDFYFYLLFRI